MAEAPVLAIYDPHAETELHCDASSHGFGAILMQKSKDLKFHPVFYFSKRSTDRESKLHSFELEMLAIIYATRCFRIYLYGIKFKIMTDCNSLALAFKKKDINPSISKWILELQNFDYTTEHREGKRMAHVDSLSRINFVYAINDNSLENNLIITQSRDKNIVKIRELLDKSEQKFFVMRNGIVYRKQNDLILFNVPEEMEKNVIFKYYDESGHLASEKTYKLIKRNYWFPEMKKKIVEHIKNCCKCIAFNPITGKKEGLVHTIPKGDKTFETLHIDHMKVADVRVK